MRPVIAIAALALAGAAASARADSLALDVGRRAYATWEVAQEDEVRARIRAVADRIDDARALAALYLASDPVRVLRVDAAASAGAGYDVSRAASEVAVELSARADTAACSAVWASALVRGRTATALDERARASAEAAAGVCLPDGLDLSSPDLPVGLAVFPLRGELRGALSRTPALTASRAALREPYSEAGFRVATEGLRVLYGDRTRWVAWAGLGLGQGWHWLGFPTGAPARVELELDLWITRVHRRRAPLALADRSIDILAIAAHGVRDDNGAAVIEAWPVRVTGLGLGTDAVLLDAAVGVAGVGSMAASGDTGDVVIETTELPEVTIAAVHAALHVGSQRAAVSLGYDRTLDTNLLAELVHEDRGWIAARRRAGRVVVDAAVFGGRARHYLDAAARGDERVVGGSLDASVAGRGGVALGVAIAATHALARDAALEGRVAGDGVRAMLTATATRALYERRLRPRAPE